MAIELITGRAGVAHVDSEDVGAYQAHTFGAGCYVLSGCECSMTDSNTAHVSEGELLIEGRHVRITGNGVDVTIENGTQGQYRNDLIVASYVREGGSNVETVELVTVKGTPSDTAAADPTYAAGSILDGDMEAQFPIFRVSLEGINVGEPVCLFEAGRKFMDGDDAADEVVDQGSGDGFRWRKWASGLAECWLIREATVDIQTRWGSVYYDGLLGISYPFEFKDVPDEQVTLCEPAGSCWYSAKVNTASKTHDLFVISPATGEYTVKVEYYATGRWK